MKLTANNLRERIRNTFIEKLNIHFIETGEENTLEATMIAAPDMTQTLGVLHGGATISLAESVAGVASNQICESDERCFGMQISASHMRSVQIGDTIRAVATIQHKGRSTHVWNVDIFSESTGKLVSSVRVTNAVTKKR